MLAVEAWHDSIQEVLTFGETYSPRGVETKEILNQKTTFDMNYALIDCPIRKLSKPFMFGEAYWITSGSALVEEIAPYNKHIAAFSDDGYIFNGAYGPMFDAQFNYIVSCLDTDTMSRQAWMTIWHPNPSKSKDHKCTIALGWYIRQNKLHCSVVMRSNDLFLGRPYDWFNFTMMTVKILMSLRELGQYGLELGFLTQLTGSAHIYEQHYDKCKTISQTPYPAQAELPCFDTWQEFSIWLQLQRGTK